MNYHKDTSYVLEPDQLKGRSKDHLIGFETAYGLKVNDEAKGEPLLMQRFRKRAMQHPEEIQLVVEENGRRVTYTSPLRFRPAARSGSTLGARAVKVPRVVPFPVLPHWAERYRPEVSTLWNLSSEAHAIQSAEALYQRFREYLQYRDLQGAQAVLIYLEAGTTTPPPARARKKKKTGRKASSLQPWVRDRFGSYLQRARQHEDFQQQLELQRFRPDQTDQ
jgi:hypothetical protein